MGRKSREKRERREAKAAEAAVLEAKLTRSRELGCLFCKDTVGAFKSEEHIVAESLGNTTLILPPGVVCDSCNNRRLSSLDQALTEFMPISLIKAIYGIESKAGKLPKARFNNGSIEHTSPGNVFLQLDSARWEKPRENGFSFTAQKHQWTPKHCAPVSRALLKMALECAWLDLGPDEVHDSKYDHVREIVMAGGHNGYLTVLKNGNPEDRQVQVRYWPVDFESGPGLISAFNYFGLYMGTDSRNPEPAGSLPEQIALTLTF